jgi:hypothetical protein
MCVVWVSEQTETFVLHTINGLVFIREVKSVFYAVRSESYAVRSGSHFALIKGVGSDVHEHIVSENRIKQLHTLQVLHFNRCLTTEYSETRFNGNYDTDNQI